MGLLFHELEDFILFEGVPGHLDGAKGGDDDGPGAFVGLGYPLDHLDAVLVARLVVNQPDIHDGHMKEVAVQQVQSLWQAASGPDPVAFLFQDLLIQLSPGRLVLDDEDLALFSHNFLSFPNKCAGAHIEPGGACCRTSCQLVLRPRPGGTHHEPDTGSLTTNLEPAPL